VSVKPVADDYSNVLVYNGPFYGSSCSTFKDETAITSSAKKIGQAGPFHNFRDGRAVIAY
jgi:hypothetical protein